MDYTNTKYRQQQPLVYYSFPQEDRPPIPGFQPTTSVICAPVVQQPIGNNPFPNSDWMARPKRIHNCPPGLEYLTMIDELLINQQIELVEALTGYETQNRYFIKNELEQRIYYAREYSNCCSRNFFGPLRPFEMNIMDISGNTVIHLYRPLACDICWFPCCLQIIHVSAPPGNLVGTVEQQWSIIRPRFAVKDATNDVVLRIEGPICTMSCCCCWDVEFQILTSDGEYQVGKITKQWSGFAKELFTDADNFQIIFPMDLDVQMKAVMIGACFLIDFMFFESIRGKEDVPGLWH